MKVTPPAKQRLGWKVSGNHDCICIHSVPFENVHSRAMHNPILRNNNQKFNYDEFLHFKLSTKPKDFTKWKEIHAIYMHIIFIEFLLLSSSQTDTHTINMHMHEQTDKHTGMHVIYTHTLMIR